MIDALFSNFITEWMDGFLFQFQFIFDFFHSSEFEAEKERKKMKSNKFEVNEAKSEVHEHLFPLTLK